MVSWRVNYSLTFIHFTPTIYVVDPHYSIEKGTFTILVCGFTAFHDSGIMRGQTMSFTLFCFFENSQKSRDLLTCCMNPSIPTTVVLWCERLSFLLTGTAYGCFFVSVAVCV